MKAYNIMFSIIRDMFVSVYKLFLGKPFWHVCPQLRLAEERCEEAESRVRQLEQQVMHLREQPMCAYFFDNFSFFFGLVHK